MLAEQEDLKEPKPQQDLYPHLRQNEWNLDRRARGIRNIGNTCYLASVMQCLNNVTPWLYYLLDQHEEMCKEIPEDCMVCKLATLATMCFYARKPVSPREIIKNISDISPDMRQGYQEDSHEFLIRLFEKVQKNLTATLGKLDHASEMTTVLGKIFGGYLRSQIVCLECQEPSNTYEEFFNISLNIDEVTSIDKAFTKFAEEEKMDDSEWFSCDRCSKKCRAAKRDTIHTLPEVLILHLKRYSTNGYVASKLQHFVKFDEYIDLNSYLSNQLEKSDAVYRLSGAVVHSGMSLTLGHYYSFIRNRGNLVDSDKPWGIMDDHLVIKDLAWNNIKREQVYMLFYEKFHGDIPVENISDCSTSEMDDFNLESIQEMRRKGHLDAFSKLKYGHSTHLYGHSTHLYGPSTPLYGHSTPLYGHSRHLYNHSRHSYDDPSLLEDHDEDTEDRFEVEVEEEVETSIFDDAINCGVKLINECKNQFSNEQLQTISKVGKNIANYGNKLLKNFLFNF